MQQKKTVFLQSLGTQKAELETIRDGTKGTPLTSDQQTALNAFINYLENTSIPLTTAAKKSATGQDNTDLQDKINKLNKVIEKLKKTNQDNHNAKKCAY